MLPVGQPVQSFGGDMQPQQQQMSNGAPQMQQQQFAAFYPQMFAQQGYSFGNNNNNSINNNNDNNNMQAMFYMQAGQPSMQIMQQNGGSAVNNNNQQQSLVNTLSRDNNSSSNNASQPSNNNQQQMQQQQPQNSLAQQFQQIFSKQNNNNNTTGSMPTTKSENRTSSTDSMQSSERDRSISSAVSTHSNSQRSQYGVSNDASSTSSTTSVLQQVSQQMQQQPQQQMNSMQQQVQQQPNFANMSGSYTIPPGYTLAQAPNGQTVLVPTGPQQYQSYFQPNSNSFSQMQQQQQQGGPSMVSNIDPQNQNASRFFPSGFMTQNGPMDGTNSFDMTKVQLSAPVSANLNAKGVSSKYRGVSWHRRDKAWTARIWNNGKSEHLGTFTTELRAALAVDIKAAAYFGDTFAEFNFPCEDERRRLIWVFMQPDIKPSSRLLEIMADPNVAVKYLAKGSSRRKNRKRLAAAMASNNSSKGDNESGSSVSSQTTGSSKVKNSKARRRDECEPHIIGLDKLRPHQHQHQAEGASDSSDSRFDSNGSNDILSKSSALRSSPSDTRKNFLRNPGQIQSGSCSSGSASSLSNEGDSGIPSSTSSGGKH